MVTAEIRMYTKNHNGQVSKSAEWTESFEAKTKAAAKASATKWLKGQTSLTEGCKIETTETALFVYINIIEE
jgi:hypothetical protein